MGDAFDMVLTMGTAGAAGWLYANWKNVGAEVGILAGELAWMLASLAVIIMLVNEWIDTARTRATRWRASRAHWSGREPRYQSARAGWGAGSARSRAATTTRPKTATEGDYIGESRVVYNPPQLLDLPLLTLDLALQAVDLTLLATVLALLVLGVALAPRQLRAEPFDLGLQVLVRIAVPDLHAKVMPQFRNLYKSQF